MKNKIIRIASSILTICLLAEQAFAAPNSALRPAAVSCTHSGEVEYRAVTASSAAASGSNVAQEVAFTNSAYKQYRRLISDKSVAAKLKKALGKIATTPEIGTTNKGSPTALQYKFRATRGKWFIITYIMPQGPDGKPLVTSITPTFLKIRRGAEESLRRATARLEKGQPSGSSGPTAKRIEMPALPAKDKLEIIIRRLQSADAGMREKAAAGLNEYLKTKKAAGEFSSHLAKMPGLKEKLKDALIFAAIQDSSQRRLFERLIIKLGLMSKGDFRRMFDPPAPNLPFSGRKLRGFFYIGGIADILKKITCKPRQWLFELLTDHFSSLADSICPEAAEVTAIAAQKAKEPESSEPAKATEEKCKDCMQANEDKLSEAISAIARITAQIKRLGLEPLKINTQDFTFVDNIQLIFDISGIEEKLKRVVSDSLLVRIIMEWFSHSKPEKFFSDSLSDFTRKLLRSKRVNGGNIQSALKSCGINLIIQPDDMELFSQATGWGLSDSRTGIDSGIRDGLIPTQLRRLLIPMTTAWNNKGQPDMLVDKQLPVEVKDTLATEFDPLTVDGFDKRRYEDFFRYMGIEIKVTRQAVKCDFMQLKEVKTRKFKNEEAKKTLVNNLKQIAQQVADILEMKIMQKENLLNETSQQSKELTQLLTMLEAESLPEPSGVAISVKAPPPPLRAVQKPDASKYPEIIVINEKQLKPNIICIFDLHGTLFVPTWRERYARAYAILTKDNEGAGAWVEANIAGLTEEGSAIQYLAKSSGRSIEQATEVLRLVREEESRQKPEIAPGVLDSMKKITEASSGKVAKIILSGSLEGVARRHIKNSTLSAFFEDEKYIIGGKRGNDRVAVLNRLVRNNPNRTIVVFDDSHENIALYRQAGLDCIFVAIPQGKGEELEDNIKRFKDPNTGADYIFPYRFHRREHILKFLGLHMPRGAPAAQGMASIDGVSGWLEGWDRRPMGEEIPSILNSDSENLIALIRDIDQHGTAEDIKSVIRQFKSIAEGNPELSEKLKDFIDYILLTKRPNNPVLLQQLISLQGWLKSKARKAVTISSNSTLTLQAAEYLQIIGENMLKKISVVIYVVGNKEDGEVYEPLYKMSVLDLLFQKDETIEFCAEGYTYDEILQGALDIVRYFLSLPYLSSRDIRPKDAKKINSDIEKLAYRKYQLDYGLSPDPTWIAPPSNAISVYKEQVRWGSLEIGDKIIKLLLSQPEKSFTLKEIKERLNLKISDATLREILDALCESEQIRKIEPAREENPAKELAFQLKTEPTSPSQRWPWFDVPEPIKFDKAKQFLNIQQAA